MPFKFFTELLTKGPDQLLDFHGSTVGSDVQRAKNFLRELLYVERPTVMAVVVYGLAVGLFSLCVPIAAQNLVNAVMLGNIMQPLFILTVVVVTLLGLAGLMRVLQRIAAEYVQNRLFARMSMKLSHTLPRVSSSALEHSDGAELTNRFFEVMTIQKTGSILLVDGLAVALQLSIGVLLLAVYHPIFLIFDLLLIIAVWAIVHIPSYSAAETSIAESKKKYRVVAWLEVLLKNPILSKDPQVRDFAFARTDALTVDYLSGRKKHFKIIIRQLIAIVILQAVSSAALLGAGGYLVMKGQLTLGQLVAAELVLTMALTALTKLAKVLEAYYDLLAGMDKLNQLVSLPLENEGPSEFGVPSGTLGAEVEFKSVGCQFQNSGGLQKKVSFSIGRGEKFALVGSNGSGKTTLAWILYGLREPTEGYVLVDGKDLRTCSLDSYRKHVVLLRGIELYPGTVFDNLALGDASVDLTEMHQVLERLGLMSEILSLPLGMATPLEGTFLPLSTGQLHRLMLARAILRKPRLLICDELLDLVDLHSRQHLYRALFDSKNEFTLLITTHDVELSSKCDRSFNLNTQEIGTV